MHSRTTSILLLLMVTALPAIAGEQRCDQEATACVKYMVENLEDRGWIGIELEYAEDRSPSIRGVIDGSPAEAAGLAVADRLVGLDGVAYATATEEELRQAKEAMVPGREVVLTIRRGGEELDVPLTLGKMPASVLAQWIGTHLVEQHRHQFETE